MIKLREIYRKTPWPWSWFGGVDVHEDDLAFLYTLLEEREPYQSISHERMPEYPEHLAFVMSRPYEAWYLIESEALHGTKVGCIYLTKQREIGVTVLRAFHRYGFARMSAMAMMQLHPGRFLANINPANIPSESLWRSLGFKLIQHTYEAEQ